MKKVYSTFLALATIVAALGLTACGGDDEDDDFGGSGKKTKSTITVTKDNDDVYYSISIFDWTSEDDLINGYLTDRGQIFCYMSRKTAFDNYNLYIYLENGEKSISDFPKGYDLGEPAVNFAFTQSHSTTYYYVSGSVKVVQNDGKSFTLQFNDYKAEKSSGASIIIRGTLYVENEKIY